MKRISVLFFLLLAGLSHAAPDPQRLAAIWDAANDRISEQVDVWFDDGDYPAVIQLLKVQYEMYPDNYDVATNLGWMQENVEMWDDAITTYLRFKNDNPQDPDAPLALADFYFRRKAYGKVPPLLEPVIKRRPHPNVFRLLAHSYNRLKMYGDALRVWDSYIALAPNDLPAKANRERVLKLIKDGGSKKPKP